MIYISCTYNSFFSFFEGYYLIYSYPELMNLSRNYVSRMYYASKAVIDVVF